jgi:hypothetical protein
VELYELTQHAPRLLSLDEAIAVAAEDSNWYTQRDLGEPHKGRTIYALYLTDAREDEYQREHAQANRT